jgi:hypothetical protein
MDLKELHRLHGGRCMYVSQGYVQWSTMVWGVLNHLFY